MGKSTRRKRAKRKEPTTKIEKVIKKINMVNTIIIGIGTIIFGLFKIIDWCEQNRKIVVQVQDEIDIKYLSEGDEEIKGLYPLFEDYIDQNKKYYAGNQCATQFLLTNHYDTEIAISEILIDVEEIVVDYTPHIVFINCISPDENQLYVEVINNGWTNIENLSCKAIGIRDDLTAYINQEALNIDIPSIGIGESIRIPFLKNSDLITISQEEIDFFVDFIVEGENKEEICTYSDYSFYLQDGKLRYHPKGGGDEIVYGIKIDTDSDTYRWSEKIIETIEPKRMLVFPICFFPDRSCSMKFRVIFKVENDGNSYYTASPMSELEFFVPSFGETKYDVRYYEQTEAQKHVTTIVSYPKQGAKVVE